MIDIAVNLNEGILCQVHENYFERVLLLLEY